MAHMLDTTTGEAASYSGGGITPWHRLGTVIPGYADRSNVLELARLDWRVETGPVTVLTSSGAHELPDRFCTYRDDTGAPLGVVGARYNTVQNSTVADMLCDVIDVSGGDARFETAGALEDGKRVWFLLRLSDDVTVGGDRHMPYLLGSTSHNGTTSTVLKPVMTRVVCNNTLTAAMWESSVEFRIRHTESADQRISEARKALRVAHKFSDVFAVEVAKLMDQAVTDSEFSRLLESVFPINDDAKTTASKTMAEAKRLAVGTMWLSDPRVGGYRGTAWGALQAVNTWELWSSKTSERHAVKVLDDALPYTIRAHHELAALAA